VYNGIKAEASDQLLKQISMRKIVQWNKSGSKRPKAKADFYAKVLTMD
jgi:hypothetical protein